MDKEFLENAAELTIVGMGPDEFPDATVFSKFETPTSESYLLEVGKFEDGEAMFVMAERFESTGWKWSNSFPEMDALQLADYLEGCAKLPDDDGENAKAYREGLEKMATQLREAFAKRFETCG